MIDPCKLASGKLPATRRGFTLIELLVVVAIISLLVSILLPSLTRAKDLAKRVLCANQMRQIGIGLHEYAHDHEELFPPNAPVTWGGMARREHLALPLMQTGIIPDQDMFTCPAGYYKELGSYEIGYLCRWGARGVRYGLRHPYGIVLVTEPCGWWGVWSHPPVAGLWNGNGINRLFHDTAVEWLDTFPYGYTPGDDAGYNNWWRPFDRPEVPWSFYQEYGD
jgi:prepilin-type N-terminal cleavage/methylation domain-containing protein